MEEVIESQGNCVLGEELPDNIFYPPSQNDKEDFEITRDEVDQIKQALKNEKFRKMLDEYAEEVQDPENRKLFQSELRQLEKQNGNTVHFINPVAGYVLKTSVNGDKKAFINLCSNSMIRKLSFETATQGNDKGTMCSIPFAQSPMREDVDKQGRFCNVYDVVFHPNTLALTKVNETIRKQVENVALEAVENSFNVKLDRNNVRRPKLKYKGMKHATMIKYKIGEKAPRVLDSDQLKNEPLPEPEEPYYSAKNREQMKQKRSGESGVKSSATVPNPNIENEKPKKTSKVIEWTEPKHNLKYRSHVDLQDFCLDNQRDGRASKPIPDEIILTVDLPLLKDSSTLEADVIEGGWEFELKAERRVHYHLKLKLPFQVHCDKSKASFDVDKRKLVVVMKTIQKKAESVFSTSETRDCSNDVITKPLQKRKENFFPHENAEDETDTASSDSPSPPPEDLHVNECDSAMIQASPRDSVEEQDVPEFINADVVVKSILKRSARSRSMSESFLDDHCPSEDDFVSLESLQEESQECSMGTSLKEKSVRFSEAVQQQLFRSNSSILGQRKKNQRKAKNKRKARGRLSSEGSVSSMDEDDILQFGDGAGADGEHMGDGHRMCEAANYGGLKDALEQEE